MNKKIFLLLCLVFFVLASCGKSETPQTPVAKNPDIPQTQTGATETEITPPESPIFTEIEVDFEHNYDKNSAHALLGGTFIDRDSDGKNEVFISGGAGQNDALLSYEAGKLVDISAQTGLQNTIPSYGAYSIDANEDGQDDLFVARQDGVYFYENTDGKFSEKKLDITFPKNAIPTDIDFADIDSDGDLDMYISTFITPSLFRSAVFNDTNHVQENMLLKNDGNLNFTDITQDSGVAISSNTFSASFVDLDNDLDPDLVISPNTDIVRIWENDGGKFSLAYEGKNYGFWMGLALRDSDNDGDIDILFSNVGTSIPEKFLQGDTTAQQNVTPNYLFLENQGNMSFTEKKYPVLTEQGFGWGIVPVDFNLDETSDYLIMQNYIKWPPHKLSKLSGDLLVQEQNDFVSRINDYGLVNKNYGISALVGDINGDNFDDVIYLNLADTPTAHLRNSDNNNRFLKIHIPNTAKYVFAEFEILSDGTSLGKKQFLPKQGLLTKQESAIIFGLNGTSDNPNILKITLSDGTQEEVEIGGEKVVEL